MFFPFSQEIQKNFLKIKNLFEENHLFQLRRKGVNFEKKNPYVLLKSPYFLLLKNNKVTTI